MATPAERQRRYRAHKRGDHTLCDPARCNPETVTRYAVTPASGRFSSSGDVLWRELGGDSATGAARALIVEACRITTRLDKLDAFLSGDGEAWLKLRGINEDGSVVKVVVDGALAEARQQAATLKQIVGELRQGKGAAPARPEPPNGGVAGVTDIASRIAARLRQTPG